MSVIIDMVLAVAMVALAPGAVAELQLRVGHIRAAADGAFVGKGCLGSGYCRLVRTGVGEGNGLGFRSPEWSMGMDNQRCLRFLCTELLDATSCLLRCSWKRIPTF